MFCTSCGARISDAANFCGACGSQAKRAAAPAPEPPPPPASVRQAEPSLTVGARKIGAGQQATCPWCGASFEGSLLSCPRCGATVDAPPVSTASGWEKLPGRKD